jgi:peptidyl-tRNA hydrolase
MTDETEYCLYILMRNDMASMNPGKAAAQAAHAANQFVKAAQTRNVHALREWEKQAGTFGTTITLSADIAEIDEIFIQGRARAGVVVGKVVDPTYPVRDGKVTHLVSIVTCAYVFGRRDLVKGIVRDLALMP